MNIIAKTEVIVNTDCDNLSKINEHSVEIGLKWSEKKKRAKIISQKMRKIGEYTRASRMEHCAEIINAGVCENCGGMTVKYANLCRDRFCPICTWRLSMRRFANMYTIVQGLRCAYPEANWGFITLTAKNCKPEGLKDMLDEMFRVWNSIASSYKFKERIAGWARSLEVTYNAKTNELHPHFHILVLFHECKAPHMHYILYRWCQGMRKKYRTTYLAQDAQQIFTGQDEAVIGWKVDDNPEDDEAVNAILETYKYTVKDKEIGDMPLSTFRATVEALKGRRLVAFGGSVKEYAKNCEMDNIDDTGEEDETEIESKLSKCYRCGGSHIVEVVGKWTGSGYLWRREE